MVNSTRWSLANQPISTCEKHFENERFVMDEAEGSKKREREKEFGNEGEIRRVRLLPPEIILHSFFFRLEK